MNRHFFTYICESLLIAGLLFAGGWAYWEVQKPGYVWTIDRTEQIVSGVLPDKEVKVAFNLKNTAHYPLRILGSAAC